jgi:hypothetical protein
MTTQPTYGIWAEIYGGTLGYRCEWLKANGEMLRYDTRDEGIAANIAKLPELLGSHS